MGLCKVTDEEAVRKAEEFCRKHNIKPGYRMHDMEDGLSVFSRISGTGHLICHPVGEPDIQSSWAMTPENLQQELSELSLLGTALERVGLKERRT